MSYRNVIRLECENEYFDLDPVLVGNCLRGSPTIMVGKLSQGTSSSTGLKLPPGIGVGWHQRASYSVDC